MIRFKITGTKDNFKNALINFMHMNCVCKFIDIDNYDVLINILDSQEYSNFYIKDNIVTINIRDDYTEEFLHSVCDKLIKTFHIDSLNFDILCKDIDSVSNIEDIIVANYDKQDNYVSRGKDDVYVGIEVAKKTRFNTTYYVRRSLYDEESEKYCGNSLSQAIRICDNNTGYKVFSDTSEVVYSSKKYRTKVHNNYKEEKRHMFIRNHGSGIKIYDNNKPLLIPDGTEVVVSKISSKKSEIIVHFDNKRIKAEINTSILSEM